MFLTWNGYEIDGSDTTYNLIMPDRQKIKELVAFYLSLPIWDKRGRIAFDPTGDGEWAPHRDTQGGNMAFEPELILKAMDDPAWKGSANFVTFCLHPEELPKGLKADVCALSDTRPGTQGKKYAKVDPVTYLYDYQSELGVGFQIFSPKGTGKWKASPPGGLIFNEKALIENEKNSCAGRYGITCGPTFIYEYAAYIMKQLAERFPELGIDGGLDCEGGFMDGCTYCVNLYDYERFTFHTQEVSSLLRRLKEAGVLHYIAKNGNKLIYHGGTFRFTNASACIPSDYKQRMEKMDETSRSGFLQKLWDKARRDSKTVMTPEDYESAVKKVLADPVLTDTQVLFKNTVTVGVACDSRRPPAWEDAAYFTVGRSPDGMTAELRVPQELRGAVEEGLRACGLYNAL